jgi:hypothetical protein
VDMVQAFIDAAACGGDVQGGKSGGHGSSGRG